MTFSHVGTWWNDNSIKLVRVDGRVYALNGWNGEAYCMGWECTGDSFTEASEENYTLRPILEGVGESDEDGDFDQYKVVGYEVFRN